MLFAKLIIIFQKGNYRDLHELDYRYLQHIGILINNEYMNKLLNKIFSSIKKKKKGFNIQSIDESFNLKLTNKFQIFKNIIKLFNNLIFTSHVS